jgi:Spy/CpxP family protein refolding chaperone
MDASNEAAIIRANSVWCSKQWNRGVCLLACSALAFGVSAQAPGHGYEALQRALGLTDFQVWQLQQKRAPAAANHPPAVASAQRAAARRMAQSGDLPRGPAVEDPRQIELLDETQRTKLAGIEKVLDRWEMPRQAVALGLMTAGDWPGMGLCFSRIEAARSELDLTDAQVAEFERIQQAARQPVEQQIWQKMDEHRALLHSGSSEDSPAVVEVMAEITKLQKQLREIRPPRDEALAVLDETQKAKLAEFERTLELAREAIELRLFYAVLGVVDCF